MKTLDEPWKHWVRLNEKANEIQRVKDMVRLKSKLEEELAFQIKAVKLPIPLREYRFHPKRKWRCDFVWLTEKLIVEVEGGIFNHGRHTRGIGFTNDCEKYNSATLLGYRVIRVTSTHIRSGKAVQWIEEILND